MTSRNASFAGALRIQLRSVGAIMMREFIARWGRGNLGFAWLYGESLVFSFPVLLVWHFVRPHFEGGVPMLPFLWTGYMPILMFRHVVGINLKPVFSNRGLLYHRRITPLDIFLGRSLLEMFGNFTAVPFSWWVWHVLGFMDWPENFRLMLLGWGFMCWWILAFALITAALSERSELIGHIWSPITYLYIFWSGFFFLAEWMPYKLRVLAVTIDPPLDSYEIIRDGYFGSQIHAYYSMPHLTYMLTGLTVLGLWLFKDVRRYIVYE
ncbi:MAG TPA: ABC transporter permease [Stellaceae bacterium]|nr:ABC transporter permease [Stellaceae bacterium]